MSSKRFLNGVKWLKENGFAAFDEEPCYRWSKEGIDVGFFRSEWYARTDEWSGDYCDGCTTPKSALKRMHKAFEEERDSFLKKAQECDEIVKHIDKALEKEEKDERRTQVII